MILSGRVWKFGDHLRSTYFFAGKYDYLGRAGKVEELAGHILEDVDPTFIERVQPGDFLVVGEAFGTGKHLEGPINALKHLGIAAVIGKSFSAAWERDSINQGFPALIYPELVDQVETGEVIELDLRGNLAKNISRGQDVRVWPTAEGILSILEAGGIAGYTANRLGIIDRSRLISTSQA